MQKKCSERLLEYAQIYKKNVSEGLKSFETKRIILFAKIIFSWLFCISTLFLLIQSFLPDSPIYGSGNATTFIILFVASIFLVYKQGFEAPYIFLRDLKRPYLPKLLSVFGDIKWREGMHSHKFDYYSSSIISNDVLQKSELFATWNKRKVDDEFEGVYRDNNFKISETTLAYEIKADKYRFSIKTFKGIIISFKSNKKIKAKTFVATHGDLTNKHSWLLWLASISPIMLTFIPIWIEISVHGHVAESTIMTYIILGIIIICVACLFAFAQNRISISTFSKAKKTKKITLEDPKFNKRFTAYSTNEIEGRYLLTPAFMERFQNLKTAFGARKIKCSFFDNQLMVAIHTNKNLFELGSVYKSLLKSDFIKSFYFEISSVLNMVEYFKLDENTGI